MKLWHVPVRLATGAFILNSGMGKRNLPAEAAAGLHGFATTAYPQVKDQDPQTFTQTLSATEIALAAALLTPLVPARLAGLGLAAFGGGLNWLYWKAPGMHEEGSIKPLDSGLGVSKDVWMTAIGLALLIDG